MAARDPEKGTGRKTRKKATLKSQAKSNENATAEDIGCLEAVLRLIIGIVMIPVALVGIPFVILLACMITILCVWLAAALLKVLFIILIELFACTVSLLLSCVT